MKLNVQGHMKCWLLRLASLLRVEHKFKCGITAFRKTEKRSMTMLVLVARARQQPMKTLKQWRKWFWINVESLLESGCWWFCGISFGSSQAIFTDVLAMKRAAAKIVPKLLNFKQKQSHIDIAQEMLTTFSDDPYLLIKVIAGNESWVYGYDIETKAQSSQWKHLKKPRLKEARQVRSYVKVLLTLYS